MKTLLLFGFAVSCAVLTATAQEQRVTAKVRQQNAAHNAEIDKGHPNAGTTGTPTAKASTAAPAKKDPIPDLATAEKVLKYQLNVVKQAKAKNDLAITNRDKARGLDAAAVDSAERELVASEKNLKTARATFDVIYEKYRGYGGTVDYKAQLP